MSHYKLLYALIHLVFLLQVVADPSKEVKAFIIQLEKPNDDINLATFHQSFLPTTTDKNAMIYSYKHAISGFSVRLTEAEVQAMEKKTGFISATPDMSTYRLSTTRSPSFLGLHPGMGLWTQSNKGKGVIIGVLDTGIFPSHPSFNDTYMPCPPAKWKGKCEFLGDKECNNKIIGARSFLRGVNVSKDVTPIDDIGHGTHTASTAAGGFVRDACVRGSASGTAAGMAPQAHLAIYKVCATEYCQNSDILAAIDSAIEDGVDIISISIGGDSKSFYKDIVAIGLFAAVKNGIFVSCPAGNEGPYKRTLDNEAPWIMTVGASTIDRSIRATAMLGNAQVFDGESLTQLKNFSKKLLPLIYAGSSGKQDSGFCTKGSLAGVDVKGKVVLCDGSLEISTYYQSQEVKDAGGAAAIIGNVDLYGFTILIEFHLLPATVVSFMAGEKIKGYINSTKSPTATILFKGTIIGDPLAPTVAFFSSRGPSWLTPGILKPDIIGPGMNILAAVPYSLDKNKNSKLTFDFYSGTSMSCPHLSGVAALLKSAHPYWSPATIKSAIMTTAHLLNVGYTPILDQNHALADVFATGAGHVNPPKATNPGLVYNILHGDYIPYLCGLGYTDQQVSKIAGESVNCTSRIPEGQLNYPTFSVSLGQPQTFNRTVTNVGEPYSYYTVCVSEPNGVKIVVEPRKMQFSRLNQNATYSVTFSKNNCTRAANTYSQGYLTWVSNKFSVRSVISVKFTGT